MKKIVLFIIIIVCLLLSVCAYAGTSEQGNAYCNGGASETVNANMYCWSTQSCCGGSGSEVWG